MYFSFFFSSRRRHTRYWRDWSSDVCSSDLTVYSSPRRMLADHPPHDLSALGIDPPPDRSRGYRAVLVTVWATVVAAGYSLVAVPRGTTAEPAAQWWPMLIVVAIGWQGALVWPGGRIIGLA